MITESAKVGVPIVVKIAKYKDDVKKGLNDPKYYKFHEKNPLRNFKDSVKNLVTEFKQKGYFFRL